MKRTIGLLLALGLGLGLAGCWGSSQDKALKRLARAEADMQACKKQVGLEGTPTPDNAAILDMTQQGKPLTLNRESVNQMRLKVECLIPLTELLEARKAAGGAKSG